MNVWLAMLFALELFAPGTISTAGNELNAAFSPDGRTVYFTRTAGAGDARTGTIFVSRARRNGRWSPPNIAAFSGRYSDYDPFVSPDGARLFFISNRPENGSAPKSDFDIWFVERVGDGWSAPRNAGAAINSEHNELYPAVVSNGTLYFSSCGRPDSRGRCDLYRSRFREGQYLEPENLGDAINSPASETDAYVAPDESYVLFAAYGRADAIGDGDLYASFWRNGAWSAPQLLPSVVNTKAREYCPIVSPDGRWLYFTREDGTGDVHRVPMDVVNRLR